MTLGGCRGACEGELYKLFRKPSNYMPCNLRPLESNQRVSLDRQPRDLQPSSPLSSNRKAVQQYVSYNNLGSFSRQDREQPFYLPLASLGAHLANKTGGSQWTISERQDKCNPDQLLDLLA